MGGERTPWSKGRRLAAACAAFAAALTLAGALDFHPAGEAHGGLAAIAQETYYPGAAHPRAPKHAESAQPAHRPLCPACLNRLGSAGVHAAQPLYLLAPALRERLPLAAAAPAVERARRPFGARAPPLC